MTDFRMSDLGDFPPLGQTGPPPTTGGLPVPSVHELRLLESRFGEDLERFVSGLNLSAIEGNRAFVQCYDTYMREIIESREAREAMIEYLVDQEEPYNTPFVTMLFVRPPEEFPPLVLRMKEGASICEFVVEIFERFFGIKTTEEIINKAFEYQLPRGIVAPPPFDTNWCNWNTVYYLWLTIKQATGNQPNLYHILKLALLYSEEGATVDDVNRGLFTPEPASQQVATLNEGLLRAQANSETAATEFSSLLTAINQYAQYNTQIMLQSNNLDGQERGREDYLLMMDRFLAELRATLQSSAESRNQTLSEALSYVVRESSNLLEVRSQQIDEEFTQLVVRQQEYARELLETFRNGQVSFFEAISTLVETISDSQRKLTECFSQQPVINNTINVQSPSVVNEIQPVINVQTPTVINEVHPLLQATVQVPQQPAPVVHVAAPQIQLTVPQQGAPVINNIIESPPPPVVNIHVQYPEQPSRELTPLDRLLAGTRLSTNWVEHVNRYIRQLRESERRDILIDWNTPLDLLLTSTRTQFIIPGERYSCPWCGTACGDHTSLVNHAREIHQKSYSKNTNILLEYARSIIDPDTTIVVASQSKRFETEEYFTCPSCDCGYMTNVKTNMIHHCKDNHSEAVEQWYSVNEFWRAVVCFALRNGRIPSFADIFNRKKGFVCKEENCKAILATSHAANNHYTFKHKHATTEDVGACRYEQASFCINAVHHRTETRTETVTEEEEEQTTERNESDGVVNEDLQQDTTPTPIEVTPVTIEEAQDTRTEEAAEVQAPQVPQAPPSEQRVESNNEEEFDTPSEEEIMRALGWREDIQDRESNIPCPRMEVKLRARIVEGLDIVMEQCIALMKKYGANKKLDDRRWQAFEGAALKCNQLIRDHIRNKLELVTRRNNRQRVRDLTSSIAENDNILTKRLLYYLAEIADLKEMEESSAIRNRINKLMDKARNTLNKMRSPIKNTIDIQSFLGQDRERNEESLKWLREHIEFMEADVNRTEQSVQDLRNEFNDNPSRTIDRKILNKTSESCRIPINALEEWFTNTWADIGTFTPFEEDSSYHCDRVVNNNEDTDIIFNIVTNEEAIRRIIRTRNHTSSTGHDGIPYSIFKLSPVKSSKFLKRLFTTVLRNSRVPVTWKRSSTILLHKGGNVNEIKNWRPISITNTQYRVFMCLMNDAFASLNETNGTLHSSQRGFTKGVNGGLQNTVLLQEIIHHARAKKTGVYITFIDLQNAFGSTPFTLIWSILEQKGFSRETITLLQSIYTGNTTTLKTEMGTSNPITVQKGVRQGCPLSPFLFSICIDPLLRALNFNHKEDGYTIGDCSISAIAYADDIVLVSATKTGMDNMIEEVVRYCHQTEIKVRPEKSKSMFTVYRGGRFLQDTSTSKIDGTPIPNIDIANGCSYLGIPIGRNKAKRILSSRAELEKIRVEVREVLRSSLAINQKIFALNTYILPKLDYLLLLGETSSDDMEKLDGIIRGGIGRDVGSLTKIPIPAFYTGWRDGGMGVTHLKTRRDALAIVSFNYWVNDSNEIPRRLLKEEMKRRGISESSEGGRLFGAWTVENGSLQQTKNVHGATLAAAAAHAASNLRLSLIRNEERNTMVKFDEDSEATEINSTRKLSQTIKKKLEERMRDRLQRMKRNGHSFFDLQNNPISNQITRPSRSARYNRDYKITISMRTNTIPSPESRAVIQGKDTPECPNCTNRRATLAHIINGCLPSRTNFGYRHDEVQKIIVSELAKLGVDRINTDCSIDLQFSTDELRRMRPDITYVDRNNTLHVVEITIPYGNKDEAGTPSLETAREKKQRKYKALIEEARHLWTLGSVEYHVIVVSSLGAIPKDTAAEFYRMLGARSREDIRRVNKVLVRISKRVVYCSWLILLGECPRRGGPAEAEE